MINLFAAYQYIRYLTTYIANDIMAILMHGTYIGANAAFIENVMGTSISKETHS